ncbi:Ectoine hydroxylase-related dioxygenase, phytanoyl-CoA dioxygenase (PhyH) family [Fictibacillus solisalsi]|uniref:Ectoine hydroxylase-related dioxygenase, phytanoyl-CoA dioxygenase (PhyH) family n=1 Tax=Fictibacillus solisalsi TaxID=459525 RepID=A0A1H0BS72_9BACL|nr:phytanoyl-CoA dioxygenase family protein [Fictibacillus solisalsi]SDN48413.1 Ectoine hydroxylase-related dioxygenase, phytanoyl-CoA dioxygenase (PhyH) family [Fictibacillus solisalsi]
MEPINLNTEYPLTEEQIKQYQKDGHIFLPQVMKQSEIKEFQPEVKKHVFNYALENVPDEDRKYYGVEKAFPTVMNMWEVNQKIKRLTFAKRFAKIAADLMGVDSIRLYHDSSIFLPPGGGAIPWHTDSAYMLPIHPDKTITMWMALNHIPEEIGSMGFVSRSHELATEDVLLAARKGYPLASYGAMEAGDATFHSGLTLHYAAGNPTKNYREVLTIIYIADNLTIVEPEENKAKEARNYHLRRLFPGRKPGDLAESELTPVLYSKDGYHNE